MDIHSDPNSDPYRHLITPRVRLLSGRELAQTAARRELIAAGSGRASRELSGLLPLSRSLGIPVAEAQRLTGYARQTLYGVLNGDRVEGISDRDTERVARLLLIGLVATGKEQALKDFGDALNFASAVLLAPARLLQVENLADLKQKGKGAKGVFLAPTERSTDWLRLHVSGRELDDRATGFTVYIKVDAADMRRIDGVAREIIGLEEGAVLPMSTAPSFMDSPELAITVRATDQRSALIAAEAVCDEIGSRLGIHIPMRIADLQPPPSAPNALSQVLDVFIAELCTGLDEETASRLRGERERFPGGEAERVLAARCLTYAARELRALADEGGERAPTVSNGDSAFEEWVWVRSLTDVSKTATAVRRPLLAALQLASERLGPFRGGELASFKAPGSEPRVVREVAPSIDDLLEIAGLSAKAIATAKRDDGHLVRVARAVVDSP